MQQAIPESLQRWPEKICTPEQAAKLVKNGQRVFVGTACATPRALTVNGLVASNRQYDRSVNVSVSTTRATLGGALAGDSVAL